MAGAVCASLDIEGLPEHASALLATSQATDVAGAPVEQRFEAYGCDYEFFAAAPDEPACRPGTEGAIGLVQAHARAHAGEPDGVESYVPPADEPHVFALADFDGKADFEVEAGVRVEDLRAFQFTEDADGTTLRTDLGSGTEPLTVHGRVDLRDAADLSGRAPGRRRGDLRLDPLPATFSYVQTGPGADQQKADPMRIVVDSPTDVAPTASAELRDVSSDGPDCGASATTCADLTIDRIPAHMEAVLDRTFGPIEGRERESSTKLTVDLDPHAARRPHAPHRRARRRAGVPSDVPSPAAPRCSPTWP